MVVGGFRSFHVLVTTFFRYNESLRKAGLASRNIVHH